jgi:hypothetical protein
VRGLGLIVAALCLSALARGSKSRPQRERGMRHIKTVKFPVLKLPPVALPAAAAGPAALAAVAIGSMAIGALAVGALAIGALAVGRLEIRKARLRVVEIDDLTVRRLRVIEQPGEGSPNEPPADDALRRLVARGADLGARLRPSDAAPLAHGLGPISLGRLHGAGRALRHVRLDRRDPLRGNGDRAGLARLFRARA